MENIYHVNKKENQLSNIFYKKGYDKYHGYQVE
jgi:hypothetical protein